MISASGIGLGTSGGKCEGGEDMLIAAMFLVGSGASGVITGRLVWGSGLWTADCSSRLC